MAGMQAIEGAATGIVQESGHILVDKLIETGAINHEQARILRLQYRHALTLERSVTWEMLAVRSGFVTSGQIRALSSSESVRDRVDHLVPEATRRHYTIMPLRVVGNSLVIETAYTLSEKIASDVLTYARSLEPTIESLVQQPASRTTLMRKVRGGTSVEAIQDHINRLMTDPSDGVQLQWILESVLARAIAVRASDLHISKNAEELDCWITYRIDGDMRPTLLMNTQVASALLTRIKTDAGLDPASSNAQDGRLSFVHEDRQIDVRLAVGATDGGESMVLRFLDPNSLLRLHQLFPYQPNLVTWMKSLAERGGKSGGIFLVTGPTGSGKTTTLQALMQAMPRERLNVMTAEDPVEYRLPLVCQTAVNADVGRTFAKILKSMMRRDPDVIVVGELRDSETAEMGLRAAESGHLMCSTLHTVDVVQSIERLIGVLDEKDRGLARFILANYLHGILNQRLIKTLCDQCSVPIDDKHLILQREFINWFMPSGQCVEDNNIRMRSTEGCPSCDRSGYAGRCAVPEALIFAGHAVERENLVEILGHDGNLADIKNVEGMTYISRHDSLWTLAKDGHIELEQAASMLNFYNQEAGNDSAPSPAKTLPPPVDAVDPLDLQTDIPELDDTPDFDFTDLGDIGEEPER